MIAHRSPTNRRYYTHDQYLSYRGMIAPETGLTLVYTRVSGVAQKSDLLNQVHALESYCQDHSLLVDEWLSDSGSGLNYKRKNFNRLMEMVELGQVRRVIIAYRDRLVRFGYEYFEAFCQRHHTDIVVMAREETSPEQELVRDLIAIVTVFFGQVTRTAFLQESVERCGFAKRYALRFHPRHCFFTLCYPAMYIVTQGNTLRLPTGGKGKNKRFPEIMATLTENAPAGYKEVAISRDGLGRYFASFSYEIQEQVCEQEGVLAVDLGIKTLATGVNEQGRFYHIGGFKGARWYNRQLDSLRSKRDRCKKGSKRARRLSQTYQRVAQKKRNKQKDCLHKASHLIVSKVVERTLVIGDLSQRQMVMKKRAEHNRYRNRAVFNDWLLYTFVQMLVYKCTLSGKELVILDERNTSKKCSGCGRLQAMPLWKRTYRCPHEECRLVMDRDENSAINILKRFLARRGPHTGDPVRCVDVFTAIEHVTTFEHV